MGRREAFAFEEVDDCHVVLSCSTVKNVHAILSMTYWGRGSKEKGEARRRKEEKMRGRQTR